MATISYFHNQIIRGLAYRSTKCFFQVIELAWNSCLSSLHPFMIFFALFQCNISHCALLYKERQQPYNPSDPTNTEVPLLITKNMQHARTSIQDSYFKMYSCMSKEPIHPSRPDLSNVVFKYIICMQHSVITHSNVTTSVTNKLSSTCSTHENLKKSRWLSVSGFPFAFLLFYLFCL